MRPVLVATISPGRNVGSSATAVLTRPSPDPPRQQHAANSHSPPGALMLPAVSRAYLSRKLTRPLPTKDGGTLRTVLDARAYMFRLSKDWERSARWQRAAQLYPDPLIRTRAPIDAIR